jgi:hypothetical protein
MNRAQRRQTARAHGWKGAKANVPKDPTARVSLVEALEWAKAFEDAQARQREAAEDAERRLSAARLAKMGFILPGVEPAGLGLD